MPLTWRGDVHACEANGRFVLLDMWTGRYAAAAIGLTAALRLIGSGDLRDHDRAALWPLIERGLLVEADRGAPRSPRPAPTEELRLDRTFVASRTDLLAAAAAQVVARMCLRFFGFPRLHALLARSRIPTKRSGPRAELAITRLAHAFASSERFVSSRDRCLARSLALRLLARTKGLDVQLVVGVRTEPFAAHCWVERDGCVLNDELDVVAQFTPLLSV